VKQVIETNLSLEILKVFSKKNANMLLRAKPRIR